MSGGQVVDGPILLLAGDDCRLLLNELRVHARALQERGAIDRFEALLPVIRSLTYVVGQADVRATFPRETTVVASDPLAEQSEAVRWVSTTEAAEMTGISRQWLAALAKRGAIEARRVGRSWSLSPAAVEALRARAA